MSSIKSRIADLVATAAVASLTAILILGGGDARGVEDHSVLEADAEFLHAVRDGEKGVLEKILDADFTWTDANGSTESRANVLAHIPNLLISDDAGAEITERTYQDVAAVLASKGKAHVLRVWVRRPGGWRALVYHEVRQLDEPPPASGSGSNDCENPCRTVPFQPKSESERAIIVAWQALETGVTAHDAAAWAPHIAEEFLQVSSNSDHPIDKANRIATLNKQKESGVASAPAPLVSAQMYDFRDAAVMTCLHQPYTGKPIHVTRLWVKRNGQWMISISFQTTIQSSFGKMSQ